MPAYGECVWKLTPSQAQSWMDDGRHRSEGFRFHVLENIQPTHETKGVPGFRKKEKSLPRSLHSVQSKQPLVLHICRTEACRRIHSPRYVDKGHPEKTHPEVQPNDALLELKQGGNASAKVCLHTTNTVYRIFLFQICWIEDDSRRLDMQHHKSNHTSASLECDYCFHAVAPCMKRQLQSIQHDSARERGGHQTLEQKDSIFPRHWP